MSKQTISATIDLHLSKKLDAVADATERKKSWLINKAIEAYLEELEDIKIAKERLHEKRWDPRSFRKAIGVSS